MSATTEITFLSGIRSLADYRWAREQGIGEEYFASYLPIWQYLVAFVAEFEDVPSPSTIRAKFADVPFPDEPDNVRYGYKQLADEYVVLTARTAMLAASKTMKSDPLGGVAEAIEALSHIRIAAMSNVGYLDRDADVRLAEFEERLAFAAANPAENFIGLRTGIEPLDLTAFGWARASVNLVLGQTGTGKSELVIKSIVENWLGGLRILVISPEMSRSMIGYRQDVIAARALGIPVPSNMALMSGRTTPDEAAGYRAYIEHIRKRDDILCADQRGQDKPMTVADVRALARQHAADFVVIDGFKLLDDARHGETQYDQHVNIFRDVLNMTEQDGPATLLVEHVTRNVKMGAMPEVQQSNMGQHTVNACERIVGLAMDMKNPLVRNMQLLKVRFSPPLVQRKKISYDVDRGDVGRWVNSPAEKRASDLRPFLPDDFDFTEGAHAHDPEPVMGFAE